MEKRVILKGLEDLAERLGVKVSYERLENDDIEVRSGRYRLRGQNVLLVDRRLDMAGRIDVLRRELRQMNLAAVYVKPYLRAMLEETDEGGPDLG